LERKRIVYRIGDLLDECKKCPKQNGNSIRVCVGCSIYTELRALGKKLERKENKEMALQMTVEEYMDYKAKGMKDKEIAELKGVNKQAIANWKYARKDQLEPKTDKTAEYKRLLAELKTKLQDKEQDIEKKNELIQELQKTIQKYEYMTKLSDDLVSENDRLREENNTLRKENHQLQEQALHYRDKHIQADYTIQNQKKVIEDTKKALEKLTKENKVLKEALKVLI
jgi:transcriptional regulator with XRE-family HTH domain